MKTVTKVLALSAVLVTGSLFSHNVSAGCHAGYCGPKAGYASRAELYRAYQILCQNPHLCQKYPDLAIGLQRQFGPIPGANLGRNIPGGNLVNPSGAPVAPQVAGPAGPIPPANGNPGPANIGGAPIAPQVAAPTVAAPQVAGPTPVTPNVAGPAPVTPNVAGPAPAAPNAAGPAPVVPNGPAPVNPPAAEQTPAGPVPPTPAPQNTAPETAPANDSALPPTVPTSTNDSSESFPEDLPTGDPATN